MSPSRFPVAWFFVLVFAFQAMVMVLIRFTPTAHVAHILWPYLANPSVAGLVMIFWLEGTPGVGKMLRKLNPWSIRRMWPMLAICLLIPLACLVLTFAFLAGNGVRVPSFTRSDLATYFYLAVIGKGIWGPGLFEEIGWRGFALPYLQRQYSALASSLIIGVVWALWHVPFFVAQSPFPWEELAIFVPLVIVCSIIFTWVYNTAKGNLLAVILLHGAMNAEQNLSGWHVLPDTAGTQILIDMPFLLVAVGLLWRFGSLDLSRFQRVRAPSCGTVKLDGQVQPESNENAAIELAGCGVTRI